MSRKLKASPSAPPPGFVPLTADAPSTPQRASADAPPALTLEVQDAPAIKPRTLKEEARNLVESLGASRVPGPDFPAQAARIFADPRITGIGRTSFDARNSWWVQQAGPKGLVTYYGTSIENAYYYFVTERGLP